MILEARVSGQWLPLAACYRKIEAREWGDKKKSAFWICRLNCEKPNYKKSRAPACLCLAWQEPGVCRICSLLGSELCIWCSADPTALLRRAWGKLASRWAYEGLSILAETLSSCNPLWLQAERGAPSTSGSWSCPAGKGASWFFFYYYFFCTCMHWFVGFHSFLSTCPRGARVRRQWQEHAAVSVSRGWSSQLRFSLFTPLGGLSCVSSPTAVNQKIPILFCTRRERISCVHLLLVRDLWVHLCSLLPDAARPVNEA